MAGLLQNKVAIITGSARGIGKEIAELYATEGATVIVNDVVEGSASEWINSSENKNSIFEYYFDICDEESVRKNVMDIKKKFGHIDILVNNAGVEYNELIGMISKENMEKMFSVNVYGMIEMIQAVSRIMARNENGGSIINISSMVGLRGNPGQLVYSASKGAVVSYSKCLALELAPRKIRVNCISPAMVWTDLIKESGVSEEQLKEDESKYPLKRYGTPEDIANLAVYMLSDASSWMTGSNVDITGGGN